MRQGDDGYCVHCDPATRGCAIHARRPHVCRQYDCRGDRRVWLDFERAIPAPYAPAGGNAPVALAEVALRNTMRASQANEEEDEARTTAG